jgi:hypothetical protein
VDIAAYMNVLVPRHPHLATAIRLWRTGPLPEESANYFSVAH